MIYDLFYISLTTIPDEDWNAFRKRFPLAQKMENATFDKLRKKAFTKMFWVVWDDVVVNDDFDFSYKVPEWDQQYIHLFKNGEHYDGVTIFPKAIELSAREFKHRFYPEKKEMEVQASSPKQYDKFVIASHEDYQNAMENSLTEMFWCIWPEVEVVEPEIFDLYISHHNVYDRNENHVFKNMRQGEETYLCGVVLFSKNKPVSNMEIRRRYVIDKKEHDDIVSKNAYDRFTINTYEDYKKALTETTTEMFWCVWSENNVFETDIFNLYFDPNNGMYEHDRKVNHVFKHIFRNEETYKGGLLLCSTHKPINKREIEHRFLVERKEHETVASNLKPYDIVFISYNEENLQENWEKLTDRYLGVYRVHGVKGIHNAHVEAAKQCESEMFWVVDGDAQIVEEFDFSHEVSSYEKDTVHVWRSKNPVNDLIYGYGGVKLLPRQLTLNMDTTSADMTTAISKKFTAMPEVSNITAFNTDPFSTWKSAFRECVKLSSRVITKQRDEETQERLDIWCTQGADRPFGEYAIQGAKDGKLYGTTFKDNKEALAKINDFEWLAVKFKELHGE